MYIPIGKPKTISDFNGVVNKALPRHDILIAIIDDEKFGYFDILKNHDFNIKELGDINDIKSVASYDIILVDIKGVGKHFGSKFEGGHVIEEIKRYYPSKILISYTAHQFDPQFNKYFQLCDFVLKKDLSSDEWVDKLVEASKRVYDPISQWRRISKSLLESDVSPYAIALLEDSYVKSLTNKNKKFADSSIVSELSGDAKQIVLNFASSALFKVIVG